MAKLGLQLYTVKDAVEKDYFGTIREVAAMGYDGIELFGGAMERATAKELKALLDELGLELAGIVFIYEELENRFEEVLQYCKDSGSPAVIFPWINNEFRTIPGYKGLAAKFNTWGKRFADNGIKFMYHVHGYEFEDLGGQTGMDILVSECDPQYAGLEIDVYWVEWAGVDSVEFVEKYGHLSPSIHFKDTKDKANMEDIEVGDGVIDMVKIAGIGLKNNAKWFIVEQEKFDMPTLKSAEISLKNLRKIVAEA